MMRILRNSLLALLITVSVTVYAAVLGLGGLMVHELIESERDALAGRAQDEQPKPLRYADVGAMHKRIDEADSVREVTLAMRGLETRYAIKFSNRAGTEGTKQWRGLTERQIYAYKSFAKVFVDEWAKYPPRWIKSHRITTIWLVKDLAHIGYPINGAGATEDGGVVYNVRHLASTSDRHSALVIHHELHHTIEYRRYGTYFYDDPGWNALHPPGAGHLDIAGATCQSGRGYTNDWHPRKGFVDTYSTCTPEEDRAEVFGVMFTSQYQEALDQLIRNDRVVRKKVRYIQRLLSSEDRSFTADYFDAIHR